MKGHNTATRWQGRACLYVLGLALGILPAFAAQALSVNLDANSSRIAPGGQTTLSWSSSGAKWCWAHGAWGGTRGLKGSFKTHRQWNKRWYAMTCSDGRRQVTDSVTVEVADGAPKLTVNVTASPAQVAPGGTAKVTWNSSGAKWCWAHGAWGGDRNLNGTASGHRQWDNLWYGITCSNGVNQVTDGVTVQVSGGGSGGGGGLTVKLDATPEKVKQGESSTLRWTASGADSCTASGGWGGNRNVSGSFRTGALNQTTSYRLTCKRGSQTALASVTVTVGEAPVVRWQAPTQNVDGSKLTDLAGYKFYWGSASRKYDGNANVTSPDWTQYQPSHLSSGRYYVAVTALDAQGNESDYSNEIQITVP